MTDNPRVEIVARALARHRLGQHALAGGLPSDTARSILAKAVEKLWPSLLDEARTVVEALDAAQTSTSAPVEEQPPIQQASAEPSA